MEFTYKNMEALVDIERFIADCVDVPRIIKGCRGCDNYGKLWSCPPFAFDPVKLWRSYSSLRLYTRKITLPKEITQRVYSPSELAEEYFKIWKAERGKLFSELMLKEKCTQNSRALAAGCCAECDKCARLSGAPCAKPALLRYSIEALGGDVERTLELYFNEKLLWGKNGHMSEYMLLVGALLLK